MVHTCNYIARLLFIKRIIIIDDVLVTFCHQTDLAFCVFGLGIVFIREGGGRIIHSLKKLKKNHHMCDRKIYNYNEEKQEFNEMMKMFEF